MRCTKCEKELHNCQCRWVKTYSGGKPNYTQPIEKEREACAKVCENGTFLHDFSPEAVYSRACARAIRARGQS